MHRRRIAAAALLATVVAIVAAPPATAQAPSIGGYVLVSDVRVTRTVDELTYRGVLTSGAQPLTGASATATSTSPSTVIVDGTLSFGPVAAGSTVASSDTFSFRQDRTVAFSWSSIHWSVTAQVANRPPVANAGANQSVGGVGALVRLDGSASSDPDGNPLTYLWTFATTPPGSSAALTSATSVSAAFTPDRKGTYVVQLVVNDGTVASAPSRVTITVQNTAPVANAGPDQTAAVGTIVTLSGSGSSDADGDPLTFAWSFTSRPVGSNAALSDASALNPTFAIDVPGTYVVRLVANDGTASSASDSVSISTINSPPVANAGSDQTAGVGQLVTLNGSRSSDVDGNALTFLWTLPTRPAGSTAALQNPTSVTPSFVPDRKGTYQARLVVNDGFVDSAPSLVTIDTQNTAPVANAGAAQTAVVGATVTLDGSHSTDVDGDPLTYQWALTMLPAGSHAALNDPTAVRPTFTLDQPGTFVAQLIVRDGIAMSAPATVSVTTTNSRPTADAGPDQVVVVGRAVALDGTRSSDPDHDVLTFLWSFVSVPSGSAAALQNAATAGASFVPDRSGAYIVQLIVNDGQLDSTPDTVTVTTTNTAPVANAGPDQLGVPLGATATLDGSASNDADGQAITFRWSLLSKPAQSAAVLSNPTQVAPSFAPDAPGDYVAQLVVNDGFLDSAPDTVLVRVVDPPPTADAGPDQQVTTGASVSLDGTHSSSPAHLALSYAWAFTSLPTNSTATLSGTATMSPSFVADVAGAYQVQLTVSDGFGQSGTDTVVVNASSQAPTVTVVATKPDASEVGPDSGTIRFTRTGDTSAGLTVSYSVGGTATNGVDYATIGSSVSFAAGQSSVDLVVAPIVDSQVEGPETVVVTLVGGTGYAVGAQAVATVTIADGPAQAPSFTLSLDVASPAAFAGSQAPIPFTLHRDNGFTADVAVTLAGPPVGVTAAATQIPSPVTTGALFVRLDRLLPSGSLTLDVSATGGGVTQDAQVTLTVQTPQPAARDLIAAAVANGTLDQATSVLYRAYALVGDPRLPDAYRGSGGSEDTGLFFDIQNVLTVAPPDVAAQLQSFTLRPADPASWFMQSQAVQPGSGENARVDAPSHVLGRFFNSVRVAAARLARSFAPSTTRASAARPDWQSQRPRAGDRRSGRAAYASSGASSAVNDPIILPASCSADTSLSHGWISIGSSNNPFRVWAFCEDQSGASEAFIARGIAMFDALWSNEVALIGTSAVPDTSDGTISPTIGDGTIDIYIVNGQAVPRPGQPPRISLPESALGWTAYWGSGVHRSAFITIPAEVVASADFHLVAAHELFHVLQYASNATVLDGGWWFVEASAKWAEAYFDRTLAWSQGRQAANEDYVPWFAEGFQTRDNLVSLNDAAASSDGFSKRPYEAFIYPYFMEQTSGASAPAQGVWQNLQGAASSDAADQALNSVFSFADNFRNFAVEDVNQALDPGDALPGSKRFVDLDSGDDGFKAADGVLPVVTNDTLEDGPDRKVTLEAASLAAQYFKYVVDDPSIQKVVFDLTDFAQVADQEKLDLDALVKIEGQDWERRDLNGQDKVTFCFGDPSQKLEQIWLVLSNHQVQAAGGSPAQSEMTVTATSAPCKPVWQGTTTVTSSQGGLPTTIVSAAVTWQLDSEFSDGSGHHQLFHPEGTASVKLLQVGGCNVGVDPSSAVMTVTTVDAQGNVHIGNTSFQFEITYPNDGSAPFLDGFTTGNTTWNFTETLCDVGSVPSAISAQWFLAATNQQLTSSVVDGQTIYNMLVGTFSANDLTSTFNFKLMLQP